MSESKLPNGGYSMTNGSNYMLDGFHFDTDYNDGVLDGARLPEAKGLSGLPEGMIPNDSPSFSDIPLGINTHTDLNIEEITREAGQNINLVDHSWLASQPEPDLDGLRSLEEVLKDMQEGKSGNPEANQLKTLQDSWGSASTDGINIIPNSNRKNIPYQNSYRKDQSSLPGDDYRQKQEKLHRKLAYGHSMKNLLSEVEGKDVLSIKSKLASEYGLHGRVYIKEEHFPGLFNGRWNEVINKRCATSMYIIPKNKDCAFDRFLGMEVVKDIPWNKAAKSLLPKLESYGVKVASGNSKERLQNAFIDLIEGRVAREEKSATWFPQQIDQSSLISLDQAQEELKNAREENIFVASYEEVEQTKIEKKLERIAHELVAQNFLDEEQVSAIVASDRTASQKIERLYVVASQPTRVSEYEGQGKSASYHNMKKRQVQSDAHIPKKEDRELQNRELQAVLKVSKLVKAGLVSFEEVEKVVKGKKTPEEKLASVVKYIKKPGKTASYDEYSLTEHRMVKDRSKALDSVPDKAKRASANLWKEAHSKVEKLLSTGLLSQDNYKKIESIKDPNDFVRKAFDLASRPSTATQYVGEETAHILGQKKSNTMSASEMKVATWVRQKISEGAAGEELDVLLATRFNQNVLNEYSSRIASIREEHEGLSGHAYVDADAYMTKGTEGCDKGSLFHRANQIPTLLKTAKCGSCVFNTGGSCQKYNKQIIASVNEVVESPASYQKEMIRLANASDSEKTASLFVNNYDEGEFNLTASENIELQEDMPSSEKLSGILFGGFEI